MRARVTLPRAERLERAALLEKLAADLRRSDEGDACGDARIWHLCEFIWWGREAELDAAGLATLKRLGVPACRAPRRAVVPART